MRMRQDANTTGRAKPARSGRQKRAGWFLLLLSCVFCLCHGKTAAAAESVKHTTTLMVYMCGSNLESRFGAATRDIAEMLSAGFDPSYTNVVLMTGGSSRWENGLPEDSCSIVELKAHGMRTVWQSDGLRNMAESGTLSAFLEYAYRQYPADRYALILWDHGGGPVEGVCYDELYKGRSMGLDGLRDALQNSFAASRKLDWLGMDACLMASVETAYTLSPYAGYLIASQEQEPSSGWNYSFLRGLEDDRDSSETGERIIDAFFAGAQEENGAYTLSCIDLSRIRALGIAIDEYFGDLYSELDKESFSELSRHRSEARSYGRAKYNDSADYDLVDLNALLQSNGETDASLKLGRAISDAVVYTRSDTGDACGMSIYYPCVNLQAFSEKWSQRYSELFSGLSKSYVQYMQSYGGILSGAQMESWSGLQPERIVKEDGSIAFRLQLSEGQRACFREATLLVVSRIMQGEDLYQYIWETDPLEPDSEGVLEAEYPALALYAVDDRSGEILAGPIDYVVNGENRISVPVIYWDRSGILDPDQMSVLYTCSRSSDPGVVTMDAVQVFDSMTQTYSSRADGSHAYIDGQDYVSAAFVIEERRPDRIGNELSGFEDWKEGNGFYANTIHMPCSWHFEVRPFQGEDAAFAAFQITDTQSRHHSSELVRVNPETVTDYRGQVDNATASLRDGSITLECLGAELHHEQAGLTVRLHLHDRERNLFRSVAENMVLNGRYMIRPLSADAGAGEDLLITIPLNRLYGVEELFSLEFDLSLLLPDYSVYGREYVRITFPEPIPTGNTAAAPLAAADTGDGLAWELRDLTELRDGSIRVTYTLTNLNHEETGVELESMALEGWQTDETSSWTLPAHAVLTYTAQVPGSINDTDSGLQVWSALSEPLVSLGVRELSKLSIRYRAKQGSDDFWTEEWVEKTAELAFKAIPCGSGTETAGETLGLDLGTGGRIGLTLEKKTCYTDSGRNESCLSLGMWFHNREGSPTAVRLQNVRVNGKEAAAGTTGGTELRLELLPGASAFEYLHIRIPDGVQPETVSFDLQPGSGPDEAVAVAVSEIRECS